MNEEAPPLSATDARFVRFLKVLVTVLTATMIFGVLSIVALLVIRLQSPPPTPAPTDLALPDSVVLPDGATATAVTRGSDWIAIVTDSHQILIYSLEGGSPRQEITIDRP
jgi:hypothetical protein